MSGAGLTQGHIQNAASLLAHRPVVKEKVKSNLTQCYESRSVLSESVPLLQWLARYRPPKYDPYFRTSLKVPLILGNLE